MTAVLVWFAGCVPPASQQPGYAQVQPADPPPPALSGCTQLVECFRGCGGDGACVQGCLAGSDEASQAQVTALMQCGSSRCDDAGGGCMEAECSAELDACRGPMQVATPADPYGPVAEPGAEVMMPGQPHTTANLLPWLQQGDGQWIGTNHQFTFHPDGRVRRASGVALYTDRGTYGCASIINDEGTVRQEGDELIMEFETQDQNHCGHRDSGPALTVRYRITWYQYSDMPVNLLLVDLTCTRGDSMYCNNQMRKR